MNAQMLARYEFKYAVHPDMMADVRRMLRQYCHIDRTGVCDADGYYTIDTLYLDTPEDLFFSKGEAGDAERLKLRVRTYPDTPGSIVKIEVKRRSFDLILKTSTVVPGAGWEQWMLAGCDFTRLSGSGRRSLETFIGLRDVLRATPRMLIRYRRQAFHSRFDDYVRITFDERMSYQPMRRYRLDGDARCWRAVDDPGSLGSAGHLLMEVKFKDRPPVWVVDLIRRFHLRRQGFSKYGSAMRRTKMEEQTLWDRVPHWTVPVVEGGREWIS